jgi:uncharacterized protein (DUF427 family)
LRAREEIRNRITDDEAADHHDRAKPERIEQDPEIEKVGEKVQVVFRGKLVADRRGVML